jgi:hypothetical protein
MSTEKEREELANPARCEEYDGGRSVLRHGGDRYLFAALDWYRIRPIIVNTQRHLRDAGLNPEKA